MISWRHGSLDMDGSNVLPTFFGKADQKVNGLSQICHDMLLFHALLSNGDLDIDDLFKLEFDGSFKFVVHFLNVVTLSDWLWGLASLDQRSAHGSDNGLHHSVGGQEDFVF